MDIKLTIDVTDRLERLCDRMLAALAAKRPAMDPAKEVTVAVSPAEFASVTAAATETPAAAPQEAQEAPKPAKGTTAPEKENKPAEGKKETPRPTEEEPAVKKLAKELDLEPMPFTDADLRRELDATRKRLLGDEPKKNPKYPALTGYIRNLTALTYNASVPSEIPQAQRGGFISDLQSIQPLDNGGYGIPDKTPF